VIRTLAGEHGWRLETELRRWHPTAGEWEDPNQPLPGTYEERLAEHAALVTKEREDARALGFPEFEVRIELPSHRESTQLAERLRGEGLQVVRRWRYLLVGVADEDGARALGDRLRGEAPQGSTVTVEGNLRAVVEEGPPNPFAIYGGMGG
jgi:hypothetical protein